MDLEEKHLSRFTLTWEVFNKHLYQSIIYTDPLIQNNLPIFISQVRNILLSMRSIQNRDNSDTEAKSALLIFDFDYLVTVTLSGQRTRGQIYRAC